MGGMSEITGEIYRLLSQRDEDKTICPSEVARAMRDDDWRELMDPIRDEAGKLADAGVIQITQKDEVVDPHDYKGPIRLRRGPQWDG